MATWEQNRLGDLVETQKGYAFKSGWYSDAGRPIVKVSDFTTDSVDSSSLVCIPEEIAADYLKYELKIGDVVVQTVGSWPTNPASVVGKCVRIPINAAGALLNQNAVKLSPTKALDAQFLFYLLRCDDFKTYIIGTAQGAASQAAITLEAIRGYEFAAPPLPVQRRIAGILSAYDELMENSQRRIRLLEAMARALYREWFVHFRFPGHEKHPRVASPLGDIPQGWVVGRIDEALSFESGRTIKKEERENGDIPVYGANGIIGRTANSPMADRCIVMGKIGSCGALHRSHKPCWITNNSFLVQPAVIQSLELAWQVLLDVDFRQYIGGAANPYMPINTFGQHEVLIPAASIQAEFERRAGPLRRLVETLSDRIETLRRTRDLLLPRLLSGQVNLAEN